MPNAMKIKLLLTIFLSIVSLLLITAQVPQGFNYQAVARDAQGNLIKNSSLPVKITIQADSLGGTILWQELHSSVVTTDNGVINLVIGKGARQNTSTVAKFDSINWNVTPKFLKTEINYGGWKTMGTSRFWSVPYALTAHDLETGKLGIKGTTSKLDEAIFEVKNKDGQTIFAVYNEGVRIYVDDGAKGPKGGFAVGGFDMTKETKREYLVVSDDSIRMYLDSNISTKKAKGGFAVGGFDMTKGTIQNYLDVSADSTRIYVKNQTKGAKGGFAVGGFDATKGPAIPFVSLTPDNYFIGHEAGAKITNGKYNSLIGYRSGQTLKDGDCNIFIGYEAGYNTLGTLSVPGGSEGSWNCFIGYQAGHSNINGANNTFIGSSSGKSTNSDHNTCLGSNSGTNNIGYANTFIGSYAGMKNTNGGNNVFLGRGSGWNIQEGSWNTFIGSGAGANIKSGQDNIIIGAGAAGENYFAGSGSGSSNIIIGNKAGYSLSNTSSNIFIGNQAGYNETGSNKLIIENSSSGTPLVYGNFDGDVFRINGNVEATVFNTVSDISLKRNVTQLTDATEKLMLIRGVYFDWNQSEETGLLLNDGRQIGVIAQDVEKVYPEIVMTNDKGYKMVDYTKLTPVLLEAIKEQQQQIDSFKAENNDLRSELNTLKEKVDRIESLLINNQ